MSIESRLLRGDNPDDVRKLFPNQSEEIDRILNRKPKKKAAKKAARKKAK